MPKTRARKTDEVGQVEAWLRAAPVAIVTDYRGITVSQIGTLRGQLRGAGSQMHIVKNNLVKIAAKRVGIEGLDDLLVGPTAITFSGDDVAAPAKVLRDALRNLPMLEVKGAILGGRVVAANEVSRLATLPSQAQLRAQLVGNIQGTLTGFVGVLQGAISQLVYTLESRASQQQQAA